MSCHHMTYAPGWHFIPTERSLRNFGVSFCACVGVGLKFLIDFMTISYVNNTANADARMTRLSKARLVDLGSIDQRLPSDELF